MSKKREIKGTDEILEAFLDRIEPYVEFPDSMRLAEQAQIGALAGLLVKKGIISNAEYIEILEEFLDAVAKSLEDGPVHSAYLLNDESDE